MTKTLKLTSAIFLFAALSGCATTVSAINSKVFSAADLNRDGYLTFNEFSADEPDKQYATREFRKADLDGDNRISKVEMEAYIRSTM